MIAPSIMLTKKRPRASGRHALGSGAIMTNSQLTCTAGNKPLSSTTGGVAKCCSQATAKQDQGTHKASNDQA